MLQKYLDKTCPYFVGRIFLSGFMGSFGFIEGYFSPINNDKNNKVFTASTVGAAFTRYPLLGILLLSIKAAESNEKK